jgi:hypothetical protein
MIGGCNTSDFYSPQRGFACATILPSQVLVLAIETALARSWMEFVPRQNRNNLNHRFSCKELQNLMPNFAWTEYLRAVGAPASPIT